MIYIIIMGILVYVISVKALEHSPLGSAGNKHVIAACVAALSVLGISRSDGWMDRFHTIAVYRPCTRGINLFLVPVVYMDEEEKE